MKKQANPQSWYGWLPDLPDKRDHRFTLTAPISDMPLMTDLRPNCSPVEDQGALGSCTANAIVGALEFLERKAGDLTPTNLSRLFVYYNERLIEGTIKQDAGAFLRDGIKSIAKWGVCPESRCPYHIKNFTHKPTASAYKQALPHKVVEYQRLSTLSEMRHCLAAGFPFVFGFTVYESFESDEVARTGVVSLPPPDEQVVGGHAVMAAGYDDERQLLLVRNSWGDDWGDGGYFWMPYAYVADRDLSDDFWTIRR